MFRPVALFIARWLGRVPVMAVSLACLAAQADTLQATPAESTTTSDGGSWSVGWKAMGIGTDNVGAAVYVNGKQYPLASGIQATEQAVATPFGSATQVLTEFSQPELPVKVTLRRWQPANDPAVVIVQAEITNTQSKPVALDGIDLASSSKVYLGSAQKDARALVGLRYPKVVPLLRVEDISGVTKADSRLSEAATATGGQLDPSKIRLLTAAEGSKRGIGGKALPIRDHGDGMVTIAMPDGPSLAMSFITAKHHIPQVFVAYDHAADRIALSGRAVFNGMELAPGKSVSTGLLCLRADQSPFALLESLAALMLKGGDAPRTLPPPIGWCSWYAIRLPLSHDFVMANAKIVAERFRALGMDLMLLDHGWQTGDLCGDWDVDAKDFPRGLRGLAADLKNLNLKMGLWIAPTDVHAPTRLFQSHPEWMLRDDKGQPKSIGRWYWEPKPERYVIDATQPGAYEYVARTMRRLVGDGSVYFKIDFIGPTGNSSLRPKERSLVSGSAPLERAMQAIRDGAGAAAYIRYCQTPPLNSLGVADGVYATMDTLDAGPSTWPVLSKEFKTTAGQYWLNKLYVHEACDLSIRAEGDTEECRLRTMMLLLSGSSIMFSDDLTKLPGERLVMMQQCMPGLRIAARPVNLFTSPTPDIWHLPQDVAGTRCDLVALFNFEEKEREMTVSLSELGIPATEPQLAREFWTGKFIGEVTGRLTFRVPARAARLISLWKLENRPQFVGTDLHLTQGAAELKKLTWDSANACLSGTLQRAPGIVGNVFVYVPEGWDIKSGAVHASQAASRVQTIPVTFKQATVEWSVAFEKANPKK